MKNRVHPLNKAFSRHCLNLFFSNLKRKKMKTLTLLSAAFLFITLGCQKHVERDLNDVLIDGEWKLILLQEGETDYTSEYVGYLFSFSESGRAIAMKGSEQFVGFWLIKDHNDHPDLELEFDDNLARLSDVWHAERLTSNKVEMRALTRDGSLKLMTLEKP